MAAAPAAAHINVRLVWRYAQLGVLALLVAGLVVHVWQHTQWETRSAPGAARAPDAAPRGKGGPSHSAQQEHTASDAVQEERTQGLVQAQGKLDRARLAASHQQPAWDTRGYVLYHTHSGLANQVISLANGLLVAHMLNRTLVVPRFRLGQRVLFDWQPFPLLKAIHEATYEAFHERAAHCLRDTMGGFCAYLASLGDVPPRAADACPVQRKRVAHAQPDSVVLDTWKRTYMPSAPLRMRAEHVPGYHMDWDLVRADALFDLALLGTTAGIRCTDEEDFTSMLRKHAKLPLEGEHFVLLDYFRYHYQLWDSKAADRGWRLGGTYQPPQRQGHNSQQAGDPDARTGPQEHNHITQAPHAAVPAAAAASGHGAGGILPSTWCPLDALYLDVPPGSAAQRRALHDYWVQHSLQTGHAQQYHLDRAQYMPAAPDCHVHADNRQPNGKFNITLDVDAQLAPALQAHQSPLFVHMGSLFGTARVRVRQARNRAAKAAIAGAMSCVANADLVRMARYVVDTRLGGAGAYVSMHIRGGDQVFLDTLTEALIRQKCDTLHSEATQARVEHNQARWGARTLRPTPGHWMDAYPGGSATPPSGCATDVLYVGTDVANFETTPLYRQLCASFARVIMLSDVLDDVNDMARFYTAHHSHVPPHPVWFRAHQGLNSTLGLFYPVLDQVLCAHSAYFVGMAGSTFSAFIEKYQAVLLQDASPCV